MIMLTQVKRTVLLSSGVSELAAEAKTSKRCQRRLRRRSPSTTSRNLYTGYLGIVCVQRFQEPGSQRQVAKMGTLERTPVLAVADDTLRAYNVDTVS